MADGERVEKPVGGIAGKPVTWKELIGKEKPAPKPRPISRLPDGSVLGGARRETSYCFQP